MQKCCCKEGERIQVLDKGYIQLIDYMGNDDRIVDAARLCVGSTKGSQQDEKLINYLLKNGHTSPFEQVVFTFKIKAPIFVIRQWFRHRTARINEVSGRYTEFNPEFYVPDINNIRLQHQSNKQMSGDYADEELSKQIVEEFKQEQKLLKDWYKKKLVISREQARINLPLSLYSEFFWQMDLNNLFKFLKLRCDLHAQQEIREYANTILNIIKEIVPIAVSAFENHILYSVTLSRDEIKELMDNKITLEEKLKQKGYKYGSETDS